MLKPKPKKCGKDKKDNMKLLGPVLIALGVGVFFANIIPAYMLIIIFGLSLIAVGIRCLMK